MFKIIACAHTNTHGTCQLFERQAEFVGAFSSVRKSETEIRSLKRPILFIEESVQALEAYRAQNNQILLEIQNSINNEDVIDE